MYFDVSFTVGDDHSAIEATSQQDEKGYSPWHCLAREPESSASQANCGTARVKLRAPRALREFTQEFASILTVSERRDLLTCGWLPQPVYSGKREYDGLPAKVANLR